MSRTMRGFHALVTEHKRSIIREALDQSGGNVAQAARALGLQPTYLASHAAIKSVWASRLVTATRICVCQLSRAISCTTR